MNSCFHYDNNSTYFTIMCQFYLVKNVDNKPCQSKLKTSGVHCVPQAQCCFRFVPDIF